jgi:hypothetical protein
MAEPAMTSATLGFVYIAERKRLPVIAALVMGMLLIAGLGTKQEFRQNMSRQNYALTPTDRVEMFAKIMARVFTGERRASFQKAGETAQERTDHLSAFAWVVVKTGPEVPYWDGETYAGFFWSFIPRFLYPDKPKKELGQAYGHRYGFLGPSDHHTSINLEQTVEMYANFGIWGVLLGMLLMGCLYGVLMRFLNQPGLGDGTLLIAAGTFRTLLNIESDFSLIFGGIIQSGILLYVLLYALAGRRVAPRHPVAL